MLFLSTRVTLVSAALQLSAFAELMLTSPTANLIGNFGYLFMANNVVFVCC